MNIHKIARIKPKIRGGKCCKSADVCPLHVSRHHSEATMAPGGTGELFTHRAPARVTLVKETSPPTSWDISYYGCTNSYAVNG